MSSDTEMTRVPWPVPLIGRERELRDLKQRFAALEGPVTRALLVRGEAGIGKSHLLAHTARDLAGDGWTVLRVRTDDLAVLVPYAALRHAVDDYARDHIDTPQHVLAGRLLAVLDVATDHPLAAVHATALRFFAALADQAPAVLVVDDLDLADEDTLVLLGALLRSPGRHPLVLAAGLRRPHPPGRPALTAFLDRVTGDGLAEEIDLGPLGEQALAELTGAVLAGHPRGDGHDQIVRAVSASSGGNPLFAVHALLNAIEHDGIGAATGAGPGGGPRETGTPPVFPADRRRAFLDRVLRAGPDARKLGRAVALLGAVGVNRVPLAAELAGVTPAAAAAAFDALVERGLLVVGDGGGFRFCHQLLRDALYQDIGPAEQAHWHRLAADWLTALPASPALDLEIAAHLQHVADVADEHAITVLARAADHVGHAAPRSALPWFEHALRITPPEHPDRPRIAARFARALLLAGNPREAITVGREALAALPEGDTRSRLGAFVVNALVLVGDMRDAEALVDSELAGHHTGLRLVAKAAHVHMVTNRARDARDDAAAVQARLDTVSLPERILALSGLGLMRLLESNVDELRVVWARLEDLACHAPATSQLAAFAVLAYSQATLGDTRAAAESIRRAQQLHAQVGWTLYRDDLAVAAAHHAVNLGDWSAALSIIESIEDDLDGAGSFMHRDTVRAIKVDLLAHRGDWVAARQAADHPLSDNAHGAAFQVWARAGLTLLGGDPDRAITQLREHLQHPDLPGWLRPRLACRLAEAEIEAGRPGRALDALADYTTGQVPLVGHPTWAAVQLTYGHAAGSIDALRAGAAVADEHRLALHSARARLLLGIHDVDAETNLTAAARAFGHLGATPWRRRTVAEIRRRGFKIPRERTQSGATLSDTEMQIARLVQLGHSNREIAAAVFLSVKTVEGHLSRIYQKTGCPNRLALTRALDAGLLTS